MTFQRDAGEVTLPSGLRVPSWDQWLLNISTGELSELQKGLVHCGGCDGRYGPRWSPTSEYVAYSEYGGELRRFLTNVSTGGTRQIGRGVSILFAPEWAPAGNRIVYSLEEALQSEVRLEDLDAGTVSLLPIRQPVRFDVSGRYLYSPGWDLDPKASGKFTTIIDSTTFEAVATVSGTAPQWGLYRDDEHRVTASTSGPVAALQGAAGCNGTSITKGTQAPQCIAGGVAGAVNRPGSTVAVARAAGTTGPAKGPGFEASSLTRYDIDLVDSGTGRVRAAFSGLLSWEHSAPLMIWNEAGTHLLVLAPATAGL